MTHRILIVDDHPLYREGVVSALRSQLRGVEVLGAGSGEEGMQVLARDPAIDLVLIDIRLPGMDGFQLLLLCSQRFPSVATMLLSGVDDPGLARRAIEAGASGFLPKSMSVAEVSAAIRHVLGGGVFTPPPAAWERPASASHGALTLRQLEVLRLLGEGRTNRDIGEALQITEHTVKAHVAAILDALGVENRTQAVVAAQQTGYLPVKGAPA